MSDLVQRLRAGHTTSHAVNREGEAYETVERHHLPPALQTEAADRIEALEAAVASFGDVVTKASERKHDEFASSDYRYGWGDAVATIMAWVVGSGSRKRDIP